MPSPPRAPAKPPLLSVWQINQLVRTTLEDVLPDCWVVGEVSGFRRPASGHFYFTIKDDRSQLACVLFRTHQRRLPFTPEDGMQVVIHGRLGIYDARGSLQFYVDALEPHGVGAQQLALEQLKQRLAAEGLFAEARKRPLPYLPRAVGLATALRGAALHDVAVTLRRRFPSIPLVLRPVRVQGIEAAADMVQALSELTGQPDVDVIILGRGGGSSEDLAAFNDEALARAIAACPVPVVSAIGHEIDFTVADLVADVRAATPTAAAGLVVPDRRDLIARVGQLHGALEAAALRGLRRDRQRLEGLTRRLRHPRQVLLSLQQRVDELAERSQRALQHSLRQAALRLHGASARLHALSPLAVLERGYCIAQTPSGILVRSAAELTAGDALHLRFSAGAVAVRIEHALDLQPHDKKEPRP